MIWRDVCTYDGSGTYKSQYDGRGSKHKNIGRVQLFHGTVIYFQVYYYMIITIRFFC